MGEGSERKPEPSRVKQTRGRATKRNRTQVFVGLLIEALASTERTLETQNSREKSLSLSPISQLTFSDSITVQTQAPVIITAIYGRPTRVKRIGAPPRSHI